MNMFRIFKRKPKEDELPELQTKELSFRQRLITAKPKKEYTIQVVITYQDEPIRRFNVSSLGHSRANAAYKAQKGLGLKVISSHRKRK